MRAQQHEAGTTIFSTGDPSLAVYVIEEGEISITVGDPPGVEVARLGPGELFGESGVLECRVRAATATALTHVTLLQTEAEVFLKAFGLNNDGALALVKLLCRRLRDTSRRAAAPAREAEATAAIRLFLDHDRLPAHYRMPPIDVTALPFQVGNRFGGEILPLVGQRSCTIPARDDLDLAAPHFELLRRDGRICVRDLGTRLGTIVNGAKLSRTGLETVAPLHTGANDVIAGRPDGPFRFRVELR